MVKYSLLRKRAIQVIHLKACKTGASFKPFMKSVPQTIPQKNKNQWCMLRGLDAKIHNF